MPVARERGSLRVLWLSVQCGSSKLVRRARRLRQLNCARPMVESTAPVTTRTSSQHRLRFVINVLWSWLGVAVNVVVGLVLSPYIVRTLGTERYGIWALVFGLLDYIWFFDLGMNTAVVNFVAR